MSRSRREPGEQERRKRTEDVTTELRVLYPFQNQIAN